MSNTSTYTIKIPHFEGPFDLLLFFIERDELDIYNIPISQITNDFLAYIRELSQMNIDLSSEFILVASTLMRIKAKMLLPRKDVDELGNEIDPRQELVERLLEYRRYKAVLEELRQMEALQNQKMQRGSTTDELNIIATKALIDAEMQHLTLFKLLKAYQLVMERYQKNNQKIVHSVVRFVYSIEERRDYILALLQHQSPAHFSLIFQTCENRLHAIFTFLALLELLQQGAVQLKAKEGEPVNDFELMAQS